MRSILAVILLLACSPAGAAEISTDTALACRDQASRERLARVGASGDQGAVTDMVRAFLASGECRILSAGERVRIERGGFYFSCVAPLGSVEPCAWVASREIRR